MERILAIVRKDTLLRFAARSEWLFFLILPIVFTLVLAGGSGPAADNRVRLVVADGAGSPLSAELIAALGKSASVRPEVLTLAAAEGQLAGRKVSAVLVIPTAFDRAYLEQGQISLELRQQANSVDALVAARAVQAVIGPVGSAVEIARSSTTEAERIRPFASAADRQAYFQAALSEARTQLGQAPNRMAVEAGATPSQIDYDPRANSSAGQLLTWAFIPLLGISALFAQERQRGTLRRLLTTPTPRATYLLGTIVGQVALALVQMLLLVAFGILVMNLGWGRSPAALAAILVTSVLAAAALGTALGTLVRSESQASGLSWMLGMLMALLGGCWYPIELFPQFVRTAAKILPTTWAMQGMLDILLRGQGVAGVLLESGVLLAFAVVFFAAGAWRFRYE